MVTRPLKLVRGTWIMITHPFELVRETGIMITRPLTRTWNWDNNSPTDSYVEMG
jgi:hypothetical protein